MWILIHCACLLFYDHWITSLTIMWRLFHSGFRTLIEVFSFIHVMLDAEYFRCRLSRPQFGPDAKHSLRAHLRMAKLSRFEKSHGLALQNRTYYTLRGGSYVMWRMYVWGMKGRCRCRGYGDVYGC